MTFLADFISFIILCTRLMKTETYLFLHDAIVTQECMKDIAKLNQTLLSVKHVIGLRIILSNSCCFNVAK